jgi:transcriptional regulator with XRE-family HTH domain
MATAASRAGVARSTWERIEHGDPGVALATLCAAADAVGLDVVIHGYPGKGSSLRDRGQLVIAQYLAESAHASWSASLEVTAGDHGQAIDQVFWRADEIVACEIVRHLRDYQGQYRSFSLKRDWLARQHRRPVRLVLAVEDLRSNRVAVGPHIHLIRSALPAGSRRIMAALRSGQPLGSDGLLWVRPPA